MKIKDNFNIKYRGKPEKLVKYELENNIARHLTNSKSKKIYEFYKCDYCGEEIKITSKWEEQTGGIVILPETLTHGTKLILALHSKCLNKVLKEFEEVS